MVEQIRPAQLPQWLAAHPQAVVLDVREPQEWQTAMVTPKDFILVTMAIPYPAKSLYASGYSTFIIYESLDLRGFPKI